MNFSFNIPEWLFWTFVAGAVVSGIVIALVLQ